MNMAVKRRQQMSFIRLTKKFVLVFDFLLSNLSITHGKRQTNKTKTFNSLCTFTWISDYFSVIKYRINTPSHVWFITPWCLDIRRNTHSQKKHSFSYEELLLVSCLIYKSSEYKMKHSLSCLVYYFLVFGYQMKHSYSCLDINWNTPRIWYITSRVWISNKTLLLVFGY